MTRGTGRGFLPAIQAFSRRISSVFALALLCSLITFRLHAAERLLPELIFESDPSVRGEIQTLRQVSDSRILSVADLAGLRTAGPPIHIRLVEEASPQAHSTPLWVTGFAIPGESRVFLFPSRSPAYPDSSIQDVFVHEIAHILLHRAAAFQHIPRWFNEGFAMYAGRQVNIQDRVLLVFELAVRGHVPLVQIEQMFEGSPSEIRRGYVISGALFRDLIAKFGPDAPQRILAEVARGLPFDEAFRRAAGLPLVFFVFDFWEGFKTLDFWLPIIASNGVWWLGITLLAIYAIRERRHRDALQRKLWEEEERRRDEALRTPPAEEPPSNDEDVSGWPVN